MQFTPSAPGSQTASVTLTSSGNPSSITLTGTGIALTGVLLSPTTQDFGTVPVNSASPPILFTVTNLTTSPVSLSTPTLTGDFALSNLPTGGSPCSGLLAPNASCFFNVVFAPTATGSRTGLLTVPASYGRITATLTGFASPDQGLSLNPTALIFNNVPGPTATQQNILLTNTGAATLQIGTPTNATTSFTSVNNCTTLAPAAVCTITVTFLPSNATVTDTLQIPVTSSTTGLATYTVPLSGAYTTESAGLQILPNQANYAATPTSTLGGTRQFTITNLTAKSLALNIALPRQFLLNGPACAALAPNASCNFNVTFLPSPTATSPAPSSPRAPQPTAPPPSTASATSKASASAPPPSKSLATSSPAKPSSTSARSPPARPPPRPSPSPTPEPPHSPSAASPASGRSSSPPRSAAPPCLPP
ncbi:choice-of-anchor D domain-containing protein [Tunturiibacter empetritectus]